MRVLQSVPRRARAKAAFKGLGFRVLTTAQESRPDCAETGVYKVLKRCL